MDFAFTREEEEFRKEVHDFYLDALPVDFDGSIWGVGEELQAFCLGIQRKVGAKGFLQPSWPAEYGGLDLGWAMGGIADEERGRWSIFWPNNPGIRIAGPALFHFGTDEQKKRYLPAIGNGQAVWFQTFTEPEAGTDESNIQVRAVADGDFFVLNGQKRFITGFCKPDFLYALARTSDTVPKHRGLTLFMIPADTPGISYRPMLGMGGSVTNEVFFDDVRVSKDCILGQPNRGFYHAMTTFEYERTNTGMATGLRQDLEEFVQYCKDTRRDGKPLFDDSGVRDLLAGLYADLEVLRLSGWHAVWRLNQRDKMGPMLYDLTGFYYREFAVHQFEVMMKILGLYGQLRTEGKWAPLAGKVQRKWQYTRSLHGGGTIEAIKIAVAGRGLAMPRPARQESQASKSEKK